MNSTFDVLILGGGPAGYSAAIYAARSGMSCAVIEQGMAGGQIATTDIVDNYPGMPGISGMELGESFKAHAESLGTEVIWSAITSVDKEGDGSFTVHCDNGEYRSKAIIAALGAKPKTAGFEGEDTFRGRGVSYCATCDGMFYHDKDVYFVGGGNAACEEALYLSNIARHVTVLVRRDAFRAAEGIWRPLLDKSNISVRYQTSIVKVEGEVLPESISFKNNETGEITIETREPGSFGIFVFAGTEPQTALIDSFVDCAADGGVVTDPSMATRTPGLYAAGDIRSKALRQVITAASDGAIAATSVYSYLHS